MAVSLWQEELFKNTTSLGENHHDCLGHLRLPASLRFQTSNSLALFVGASIDIHMFSLQKENSEYCNCDSNFPFYVVVIDSFRFVRGVSVVRNCEMPHYNYCTYDCGFVFLSWLSLFLKYQIFRQVITSLLVVKGMTQ